MGRAGKAFFWTATATAVLLAGVAAAYLPRQLAAPNTLPFDIRPTLLCISLVGLRIVSYAVWFSRWNVYAHTQLVFSVVAYVVPIYFLRSLDRLNNSALTTYYQVVTLGFFACLVGALIGARFASQKQAGRILDRHPFTADVCNRIAHRTFSLGWLSVIGIVSSFVVMGFIPALTPDPLVAKFFRGEYAAAYAPVAVPYRFSTATIGLILPLIGLFWWLRRRVLSWWLLLAGALGVMMLGLLRGPAVAGLLILIGVVLAVKRRGLPRYFVLLVAAYFSGAALYALLATLGMGGFATSGQSTTSLLGQVAAGAPDIHDQITFLTHWLAFPQYTDGKTFVGGLIPGNYPWNSSVWSLHVVNPGVRVENIASGGLRLPAPIWGLVSFGWPGVILVSFLSGLIRGYLARLFAKMVPSRSITAATNWTVLYTAMLAVLPVFYRLQYVAVLQLAIVWWLLFAHHRGSACHHDARTDTPPRSGQEAAPSSSSRSPRTGPLRRTLTSCLTR